MAAMALIPGFHALSIEPTGKSMRLITCHVNVVFACNYGY
jgi:hypothetical protein